MAMTRKQLDTALDRLAESVPRMMELTSPESQMDAYAGQVADIEEHLAPEDREHFWTRSQCIFRDNQLIPGDDEPCSA